MPLYYYTNDEHIMVTQTRTYKCQTSSMSLISFIPFFLFHDRLF